MNDVFIVKKIMKKATSEREISKPVTSAQRIKTIKGRGILLLILICGAVNHSIPYAHAAKKDAIYTGPAQVFTKPYAWQLNELEKCFGFNSYKFAREVAKLSWADYKNLMSGSRANTGCYDRQRAKSLKTATERKLVQLRKYVKAQQEQKPLKNDKKDREAFYRSLAATLNNSRICLEATTTNVNTGIIIWNKSPDKKYFRDEASDRNLKCDVGEKEIVILQKQFSNFNTRFLCNIAKKQKSDLHWSESEIDAAACLLEERNIPCEGANACSSDAELIAEKREKEKKAAEAARLAEETAAKKLAEEAEAARLAEEERKRKVAEAARLAEEERKRKVAEEARLAEEKRKRKAAEEARLAKEAKEKQKKLDKQIQITKIKAENLYSDIADYVKSAVDVDLLKFAQIFQNKPDVQEKWDVKTLEKYTALEAELFKDLQFKIFHENMNLERQQQYESQRARILLDLESERKNLETILKTNFGESDGMKAAALLKNLDVFNQKIDKKTNSDIEIFLQNITQFSNRVLNEKKEKEKLIANIEDKKPQLLDIIKENFGSPISNEASQILARSEEINRLDIPALKEVSTDVDTIIELALLRDGAKNPRGNDSNKTVTLSASATQSPQKPPTEILPVQEKFITAVIKGRNGAAAAANDMARGGILAVRNTQICNILPPSLKVINWVGTVKTVDSNSEGKGVFEVEIAEDVILKTWNNAFSDLMHDTLLEPNSAVFNKASLTRKGQKVKFEGSFFSNSETCIDEGSVTLKGDIEEPEFIFKFKDVQIIN